jgi:hypothetical protein
MVASVTFMDAIAHIETEVVNVHGVCVGEDVQHQRL